MPDYQVANAISQVARSLGDGIVKGARLLSEAIELHVAQRAVQEGTDPEEVVSWLRQIKTAKRA